MSGFKQSPDNVAIKLAIKKKLSFFFFCGIEKEEVNQDGLNSSGNVPQLTFKEWLYYDSPDDSIQNVINFSMNEEYAFFWSLGNAWKMGLID